MEHVLTTIYRQAMDDRSHSLFRRGQVDWALISHLINSGKVSPTTEFINEFKNKMELVVYFYLDL